MKKWRKKAGRRKRTVYAYRGRFIGFIFGRPAFITGTGEWRAAVPFTYRYCDEVATVNKDRLHKLWRSMERFDDTKAKGSGG